MALAMALLLSGCESSQERSAQLEHEAKHVVGAAVHGLLIRHASTDVKVLGTQVLHDPEGAAVLVTVQNTSRHAVRDVPLAVTVKDAGGAVLYRNDAPGLEPGLTSVPLLGPGERFIWIDDQVQASSPPASASAVAGEAATVAGAAPRIRLSGVHATAAPEAGVAGTVANDSGVTQHGLVVYGSARRGGKLVAAGRAVLSELPAHSTSPFQVLFIGDARGAHVEASAPPATL
ncbi:MAG TPA: hypothetical protein VGI76_10050 [Solirubrobacteraceae bacterium]